MDLASIFFLIAIILFAVAGVITTTRAKTFDFTNFGLAALSLALFLVYR